MGKVLTIWIYVLVLLVIFSSICMPFVSAVSETEDNDNYDDSGVITLNPPANYDGSTDGLFDWNDYWAVEIVINNHNDTYESRPRFIFVCK